MNYYLSIDAGTSVIKAVLFNKNFELVCVVSVNNQVLTDHNGKSEIDMNKFWLLTCKCIKSCIIKSKIKSLNIDAVGITGNIRCLANWSEKRTTQKCNFMNDTRSGMFLNL